jgi:protoporphyrinogen/coproporphyrinogen III oxidase
MVDMERDHGSLFRGMLARKRSNLGPARLMSFDEGMGLIPRAMLALLGGSVVTGAGVTTIERQAAGWRIQMEDGCWLEGDHVVLATPAHAAAGLVAHANPVLAESLRETEYAGVSVVALGYRQADVPRPLDGYGYLVTRAEDMATLGVVWESSLFAGRAPDGHVLLRAILGGVRRPSLVDWTDEECVAIARSELTRVLGVRAEPAHISVFRWPKAIAQYTIGHHARLARVRGLAGALPGLHMCGTSYDGVSFNHAVKSGRDMARSLASRLWRDARTATADTEAHEVAV